MIVYILMDMAFKIYTVTAINHLNSEINYFLFIIANLFDIPEENQVEGKMN